MRHVNYTLKPATIDNAKPREKACALTDGDGLPIEVLPSGSKTWRLKYRLNGMREKQAPAREPQRAGAPRRVKVRWRRTVPALDSAP